MNRLAPGLSPQPRKQHSSLSNHPFSPHDSGTQSRPRTPIGAVLSTSVSSASPSNRRRPLTSNEWISSRFGGGSPSEFSRFVENSLTSDLIEEYCSKIDALSQELQSCKRQLILQQKKSERALADLAATGADEIAAVHHHYSILIKDLEKKMQDMQAQIDAEQNMKRDWTQAQRKNIQSARSQAEKFTVLQHTCEAAVLKATKLDSFLSEQLHLNQVQADRIATLESENAALTNKVVGMQNAATARATSMQRMQNEIQRVQATLKNKLHVDKKVSDDRQQQQQQDTNESKSPPHMSQFVRSQLGSPTVQLSTFPPPPCSDPLLQDTGGGGVASADGFRVLANPSTGFELKTNVGFQLPAFPPSRPMSSEKKRGAGATSPTSGRGEGNFSAQQQLASLKNSPRAKSPEIVSFAPP